MSNRIITHETLNLSISFLDDGYIRSKIVFNSGF